MRSTLAFLFAALLLAADPAGKYTGKLTVATPDGDRALDALIIVQASGDTFTVSAGPNEENQVNASKVKSEGDKLTFEVHPPNSDQPWVFDLTLDGKRLQGSVKLFRNGEPFSGKVDATRP